MYFYLRVINPVISLLVLILCTWAAICGDHNEINIAGIIGGNFGSYFFAKGLFTSSSLLIIGKILLEMLKKSQSEHKLSKRERFYSFAFLMFTLGALIGLYFWGLSESANKNTKTISVSNPPGVHLVSSNRIKETTNLRLSIKIKNESQFTWVGGKVYADLYIKDMFSGKESTNIPVLMPNQESDLSIDYNNFMNDKLSDSISFKFNFEMLKEE